MSFTTDERPGSLEDPGPAPAVERERDYEYDFFDFDEDAAITRAERSFEQWIGRT